MLILNELILGLLAQNAVVMHRNHKDKVSLYAHFPSSDKDANIEQANTWPLSKRCHTPCQTPSGFWVLTQVLTVRDTSAIQDWCNWEDHCSWWSSISRLLHGMTWVMASLIRTGCNQPENIIKQQDGIVIWRLGHQRWREFSNWVIKSNW